MMRKIRQLLQRWRRYKLVRALNDSTNEQKTGWLRYYTPGEPDRFCGCVGGLMCHLSGIGEWHRQKNDGIVAYVLDETLIDESEHYVVEGYLATTPIAVFNYYGLVPAVPLSKVRPFLNERENRLYLQAADVPVHLESLNDKGVSFASIAKMIKAGVFNGASQ